RHAGDARRLPGAGRGERRRHRGRHSAIGRRAAKRRDRAETGMSAWWHARSERERWLVGVMLVLAAILLGWLLIVRPLADALDAARMRHGETAVALAQARARAQPSA